MTAKPQKNLWTLITPRLRAPHLIALTFGLAVISLAEVAWSQAQPQQQQPRTQQRDQQRAPASAAADHQALVTDATAILRDVARDPNLPQMRQLLGRAKAVYIAPRIVKAAFILGGEGGSGVMMARMGQGQSQGSEGWSLPAFYTLGAGSVGLQAGVDVSEVILLIMTDRGLNAILNNQLKLGADAAIAAGPLGRGVEASTTTALDADIYAYSRSQGLFGGFSLEGGVLNAREEWNRTYYGRAVTVREIFAGQGLNKPAATELRRALSNAAAG